MAEKILIYGKGKSGKAVAKLFGGCEVYFYDDAVSGEDVLNFRDASNLAPETDLMVISPGVPYDSPLCVLYGERGVPIKSELEIAVGLFKGKIAAVTGTNGKTTVCRMLSEILSKAGIKNVLAGNVGTPFSEVCFDADENSVAVLEASSFQLERYCGFSPFIAAVTNMTPDHLDRHKTMSSYIKAKRNIISSQNEGQHAVLNFDDENVRRFFTDGKARKSFFGLGENCDCRYDGGKIVCGEKRIAVSEEKTKFSHNIENMMCAALAADILGADEKSISEALDNYVSDRHRIEYVGSVAGVDFFDDSKATNIAAAIAGVNGFENSFVIMGGSDKGYGFEEFFEKADPRYVCAFGQTGSRIYDSALHCGFYNIDVAENLKQAVENCYRQALLSGGTVVLAPACASFDMFADYRDRGEKFVEIVKNIISKKPL